MPLYLREGHFRGSTQMIDLEFDKFRCEICYYDFDSLLYQPKVICQQFHIICRKCFERICDESGDEYLTCPFCKESISKYFAIDFLLLLKIRVKFQEAKRKERRLNEEINLLNKMNAHLEKQVSQADKKYASLNSSGEHWADWAIKKNDFFSVFSTLQAHIKRSMSDFRRDTSREAELMSEIAEKDNKLSEYEQQIEEYRLHLNDQKLNGEEREEEQQEESEEQESQSQIECLKSQNSKLKADLEQQKSKVEKLRLQNIKLQAKLQAQSGYQHLLAEFCIKNSQRRQSLSKKIRKPNKY